METRLPRSLPVNGTPCPIRWDYRAALDLFESLNAPELDDRARGYAALTILYREPWKIPQEHRQEAVERVLWFLRGGRDTEPQTKKPRLLDWRQDFPLIVPPVNRVLGYDIRESRRRVHWWTVLAAYNEIGDCYFSQIISIRSKKSKGKKLDKADREFYRENKEAIDFKVILTAAEEQTLSEWLV